MAKGRKEKSDYHIIVDEKIIILPYWVLDPYDPRNQPIKRKRRRVKYFKALGTSNLPTK